MSWFVDCPGPNNVRKVKQMRVRGRGICIASVLVMNNVYKAQDRNELQVLVNTTVDLGLYKRQGISWPTD
jgi:hypothetical protein